MFLSDKGYDGLLMGKEFDRSFGLFVSTYLKKYFRWLEGYIIFVVTIGIFAVIMLAIRSALLQEDSMAFEVFISYSHKDRKYRDELATHLSNLRNQRVISDWYDGDIHPETE